jgi:uncharacterized membrane protein
MREGTMANFAMSGRHGRVRKSFTWVPALLALVLVFGCGGKPKSAGTPRVETSPRDTIEYSAHGNEPFWSVSVTPQEIVFREPEHIDGVRGRSVVPERHGTTLIFRTRLADDASTPVELTLDERPCQDSMSGFSFQYSASARIGDRVLTGCAEQRPAAPLGDWTVGGHRIPGTSAMNDAEAMAWHERPARFTTGMAVFGADTCRGPSYDAHELRGDSLLAVDYHADPAVFGLSQGARIRRIEVRCDSTAWAAPGGTLLLMPSGTLYTVWDGVFFELRRKTPSAP